MIFTPENAQKILDGTKTQTRRIVKDGDTCTVQRRQKTYHLDILPSHVIDDDRILRVWGERAQRWTIDRDYAVQPGRCKKAVGRIRITAIRIEPLQDITNEGARAEGVGETYRIVPYKSAPEGKMKTSRLQFMDLWKSIHKKPGTSWLDKPLVWVLEFDLVKEATE